MAAARVTGALLEARATYDQLTGRENLDITRRLLSLAASEIDRVLEAVDMRQAADRKLGHYSLGMRQRLGLARAMLGAPRLLVLDEPMNGLDPDGIRDMRAIIRTLPERVGATVFMSSHMLSEVEQTATHIGLMHDGRLVLDGPISDMLRLVAPPLSLRVSEPARAAEILNRSGYAPALTSDVLIVKAANDMDAARINRLLIEAGIDVIELSFRRATLEALYVSVQEQQAEAA
jgi:lantibiotic transport system ATP-binding protein